jgi:hypothetical protein
MLPAEYGLGTTVKFPVLVACPAAVCTEITPVPAWGGTLVVIVVADAAETVAMAPPIVTVSLSGLGSKFVPLIVTNVLELPIVGLKLIMVGALGAFVTVKVGPVAFPDGAVTVIGPVAAPEGTDATI